jgi:hypothetical protein
MKHLISLLAFSFLIGCDGEKSNVAPSKDSPEEAATEAPSEGSLKETASEAKQPEAVSVNPNLKYEIKGDTVTITRCAEDASGELVIPDTIEGNPVTSIGGNAFLACNNLTSITIPDSVTSIGNGAFAACTSLTSITIGNGVTSIGRSAFYGCTSLTTIEVGAANVNYTDVNGVLFNKEKTLLHTYPADKTGDNYVIPDGVTTIGNDAFRGCTNLRSIAIPNSVTSIGRIAFFKCSKLTSITIPDGVTSIGASAFTFCDSLTSITIPDGVTSIGQSAFWSCPSLKSITIPNRVTSIGGSAFFRCRGLSAVTFLGDAPKIGANAFKESSPTIYREADAKGWGDTLAGRPVKLITEKP